MRIPQPVDTAALGHLLALRYRLQWARVRSREGRIAFAVVGTLVLAAGAVFLGLGGLGGAVAAVRAGQSQRIALGVLTQAYLLAIAASLFLGIGVNAAFSNATLRRYPLSAADRFVARHLTACLDPLWFACLALYLGVAVGFAALGVTPAWLTVPAALLLVVTNWLAARVLMAVGEVIMGSRLAPFVLAMLAAVAVATPPLMRGSPLAVHLLSLALGRSPAGAAAKVMAGGARAAVEWLACLAGWTIALAWALVAFDRLPARSRSVPGAAPVWNGICDRVGGVFSAPLGPLVTKMLRYYTRSPQVRWNFPFVLPFLITGCLELSREGQRADFFVYALGTLVAVGFLCTGAMSLNLFGFDGAGFRRYFLLPASPAVVVRAATIAAVLPGAVLVTIALVAWAVVPPVPTDARMFVMLAASGFGGTLVSQAGSLWIAVLWPRPAVFTAAFGNRLSAAGGAALCAGVLAMVGVPFALHAAGQAAVLRAWALWPIFGLVACGWYLFTLHFAARAFASRREEMLTLIEGEERQAGAWLVR